MSQDVSAPPPPSRSPWWRQPMMWLVVGGPAVVVVAAVVTAVVAFRMADPVVSEPAASTRLGAESPAVAVRNQGAAATATVKP